MAREVDGTQMTCKTYSEIIKSGRRQRNTQPKHRIDSVRKLYDTYGVVRKLRTRFQNIFKGQQNNGTRHHGLQVNWKTFAAGINSHKARICSLGILPSGVAYSGLISARKKAVALALGQHTNSEAVPPLSSTFRHEVLA